MITKRCTATEHLAAVVCVIALGIILHTAFSLSGINIDGSTMARADMVYDQRIVLPGGLR
jgi:hypothetical protein